MRASSIYCVGRNFASHADEMGSSVPEEPIFFQKSSVCLSSGPVIILPPERQIHHELEIVVNMSEPGYRIPTQHAWDHVGGLCLGLDLTDRPLQDQLKKNRLPWFLAKSFPCSAIVTRFEPPQLDIWKQDFWLTLNGRLVQEGNINDMLFDIATLISYLSERLPLGKGDLIYTGTPNGVGPINDGDELVLGIANEVKGEFTVKKEG